MTNSELTRKVLELENKLRHLVVSRCDELPTTNISKLVIYNGDLYFWGGVEYEKLTTEEELTEALGNVVIGANIEVVSAYSNLPSATGNTGKFYWVENDEGTWWMPGSLGGTYYKKGLYYSTGTVWETAPVPYQATQIEVDAGIEDTKFVTSKTLKNNSKWTTKVDTEVGKGLSEENFSTIEKTKLSGIESGAQVNNISNTNATDLTDGGTTTLHNHDDKYSQLGHTHTKSEVGLNNVDNTSDLDKPISTLTQTALNGKSNTGHTHIISNIVNLQIELDGKQPISAILTNTTESFTTALKNAYDNTVSWISTNSTNILNHLINTSNPHNVTKTQVGLSNVDNVSAVNLRDRSTHTLSLIHI